MSPRRHPLALAAILAVMLLVTAPGCASKAGPTPRPDLPALQDVHELQGRLEQRVSRQGALIDRLLEILTGTKAQ